MKRNILLIALALCMSLSAAAQVVTETRKVKQNDNTNLFEKVPEEGKYVGYAGIEIISPGAFGDGGANFGVTTTHGLMVNESIFVGGGLGYIADFHNNQGLFPVFADARYFFRSQYQRRIYPHIAGRLGVQIPTQGNIGFLGQIGIGLRVPFSESFAMNIEVGPQYATRYERQHAIGEISDNGKPFKSNGYRFAFFSRINFEF